MYTLFHRIYLFILVSITLIVTTYLIIYGDDYYLTALDKRFFHEQNELLKPSGFIGHGIGIIGSLMMLVGVFSYMARKRMRIFSRLGLLKHWLEFHIFLCTLGPILVLFHTSFKFGGIVSISFWSMIAVVLSGVIGRVIYLQIPRTIEGRELTLNDLNQKKVELFQQIQEKFSLEDTFIQFLGKIYSSEEELYKGSFFSRVKERIQYERIIINKVKLELRKINVDRKSAKHILKYIKGEIVLNRRIAFLATMNEFLKYWHVIHLPFALIMLVIMLIHVAVVVLFGYTWIF